MLTLELDTSKLDGLPAKTDAEISRRLGEVAHAVEGKAKEKMSGSRSGRVYRVPGTNRDYTASAPGEPPAVMTGNLKNSIVAQRINAGEWQVQVGTEYAARMEFGGTDKRGVYISPRPYLRPSIFSIVNRFPDYFKDIA